MRTYCVLPDMPTHCHLAGCRNAAVGYFLPRLLSGNGAQIYGICEQHLRDKSINRSYSTTRFEALDPLEAWRRKHIG